MSQTSELLIVAGHQDGVATRLQHALETKGHQVFRLDGMSAARIFSINLRSGATSVEPSLPMFVRPSAWWHQGTETADERFLRAEAYATFWAAAALSSSPVINRPGRNGYVGRMTWGAIASTLNSSDGTPELHASGPEAIADPGEEIWGEDADFRVAPLANLRHGLPIRAHKVGINALYEIVTVVGQRAFSATSDPLSSGLDLVSQSLAIARRVGVSFATVTWAVDERGAVPVRLNAAPEESELRYAWSEVVDALCEELTT
ncbi:MAG: hypothetical protein WCC64_14895 [Aliidongia sp.]